MRAFSTALRHLAVCPLLQLYAALSDISPQQLAAQTAANTHREVGSPPIAEAPSLGPVLVSPAILASLEKSARAGPAASFYEPPSPDLPGQSPAPALSSN